MSDTWMLYWLTRLDPINSFLWTCIVLLGFGFVCCGFVALITAGSSHDKDVHNSVVKGLKYILPTFLVVSVVHVFVPNTKDAMFIAGGAAVIEAAKSEPAKRIAAKSVQVVEEYLDGLLKDKKEAKK